MRIEKFGVYLLDLPVQKVTRGKRNPTAVVAMEMNGVHRCVVIAIDEGRGAVVVPLTSATDANGGEKFNGFVNKSWARVVHNGKYAYAMCEQIRYADSSRLFKHEGYLGDFDARQIEQKLRATLGL